MACAVELCLREVCRVERCSKRSRTCSPLGAQRPLSGAIGVLPICRVNDPRSRNLSPVMMLFKSTLLTYR